MALSMFLFSYVYTKRDGGQDINSHLWIARVQIILSQMLMIVCTLWIYVGVDYGSKLYFL